MENLYAKNCIRTFTGIYFDYINIDPDKINIIDIAHSLSMQPRFAGHLPVFYSVAQHCVLCSTMIDQEYKLEALLHDASEAYLLDMPKPVKHLFPEYVKKEAEIQKVISKLYNLPYPMSKRVKEVDKNMLTKEWEEIMLKQGNPICWSQEEAKNNFLFKFHDLYYGNKPNC